jgi:pyruvate formate lyase activating enzyme
MLQGTIILRKTSFVDYPALVSAVIFFYGCNLRCPWCHNRELVTGREIPETGANPPHLAGKDNVELEKALEHIEKRRKVLGGVVLSGGEPTLFSGLPEVIARIKALKLRIKIDTNGMRPDILEKLFSDPLSRPDYIAMDLKLAPERYVELLPGAVFGAGLSASMDRPAGSFARPESTDPGLNPGERLRRSAELIRQSGIAHEFRSLTLPRPWFGKNDLDALAPLAGSSPWHIRSFVPGNCLDPAWDLNES